MELSSAVITVIGLIGTLSAISYTAIRIKSNDLKEDIYDIRGKNSMLESQVASVKEDIKEVKDDIKDVKQDVKDLSNDVSELKSMIAQLLMANGKSH